jgi:hypothetical protein
MRLAQIADAANAVDIRRKYETNDGTSFSEPRHLPPRMDLRKPRALPDMDLVNEEPGQEGGLPRFAAMTPKDQEVNRLDQLISQVTSSISNLRQAAEAAQKRANAEGSVEQQHNAERIVWIISDALQPWMVEIDQHFDQILAGIESGDQDTPPTDQQIMSK